MKDEEKLFHLSTRIIMETIQPLAMREKIAPSDMIAILTIIMGRLSGKMGYRNMNGQEYWDAIVKNGGSFFVFGFDSERQNES